MNWHVCCVEVRLDSIRFDSVLNSVIFVFFLFLSSCLVLSRFVFFVLFFFVCLISLCLLVFSPTNQRFLVLSDAHCLTHTKWLAAQVAEHSSVGLWQPEIEMRDVPIYPYTFFAFTAGISQGREKSTMELKIHIVCFSASKHGSSIYPNCIERWQRQKHTPKVMRHSLILRSIYKR